MRWRGRGGEGGQRRRDRRGDGITGHNVAGSSVVMGPRHHTFQCVTPHSSSGIVKKKNNIVE